jgi:Leucine-rich repeat (LRR) protein
MTTDANTEIEFTLTHADAELACIPAAVFRKIRLVSINLSHNHIVSTSGPLLPLLQKVDLSFNRIESIERVRAGDSFLFPVEELSLQSNRLRSFPSALLGVDLVKLNLSQNSIETLPKRIDRLRSLTTLKLEKNLLTTLPRSIGNLRRLELLDVRSNRLVFLPPSLVRACDDCDGRPKILLGMNPRLLSVALSDDVLHDYRLDVQRRFILLPDTHIQRIASEALILCVGLQDLGLPALITLEIIDVALPNNVRMWAKWELITTVKHFHDRFPQSHTHGHGHGRRRRRRRQHRVDHER